MRLDLRRVGVEFQTQRFNQPARKALPIEPGIGSEVRVIAANRAVRFAGQRHGFDGPARAAQPVHEVGELFAQRARGGRLPVSAGEHRIVRMAVRHGPQHLDHLVQLRQQHRGTALLERQSIREVVDVFGGAGEVNELRGRFDFLPVPGPFFEPVLDRLHVVVGLLLDRLDALGITA